MKPKKLSKKITFTKSTVAILDGIELKNAQGGYYPSERTECGDTVDICRCYIGTLRFC